MKKIPQEFIDDLLSRVDIVEIIKSYISLKKVGRNYQACCPFHSEKTPSFVIYYHQQVYHCFGCGAHGSVIRFIMQHEGLSFYDVLQKLSSMVGLTVPTLEKNIANNDKYNNLYKVLQYVARQYHQNLQNNSKAREYLEKRNISSDIIELYNLGFAKKSWDDMTKLVLSKAKDKQQALSLLSETGLYIYNKEKEATGYDRFRNRLIFPIYDIQGRIIAFGGRIIDDNDTPKYLNSPETTLFHKGKELYGLYQVLQRYKNLERVVVVEGYMDVLALMQHGIDNAVAVLGTSLTKYHLYKLLRYSKEVVLCFDGDQAGFKAAVRSLDDLLEILSSDFQIKVAILPNNHDPDSFVKEYGKNKFNQILLNAQSLTIFLLKYVKSQVDLTVIDGKVKFIDLIMPYIEKLNDSTYSEVLIGEAAKISGISYEIIKKRSGENKKIEDKDYIYTKKRELTNFSKLNLVKKALCILLQNPKFIKYVDEQILEVLSRHSELEYVLFRFIYNFVKQNPGTTTASIAESIQQNDNEEYKKEINSLVTKDLMVTGENLSLEFVDILKKIHKKEQQILYRKMLDKISKQNLSNLSDESKRQIKSILMEAKESK